MIDEERKRAPNVIHWEDYVLTNTSWSIVSGGILVTTVLIGIFVLWKMLKEKRSGFPSKDERTQKVTGSARGR